MAFDTTETLERVSKGRSRWPKVARPDLTYTRELAAEMAPLYEKVKGVVTPMEWPHYAPLIKAINTLKKERNAVILAHNYMTPEIF